MVNHQIDQTWFHVSSFFTIIGIEGERAWIHAKAYQIWCFVGITSFLGVSSSSFDHDLYLAIGTKDHPNRNIRCQWEDSSLCPIVDRVFIGDDGMLVSSEIVVGISTGLHYSLYLCGLVCKQERLNCNCNFYFLCFLCSVVTIPQSICQGCS